MKVIALLSMIFCHIVDDYYLQGVLSKMKQKIWWEENAPQQLYKFDYIAALIVHAFSWTFMITLPIFLFTGWQPHFTIYIVFGVNVMLHSIIDDLKANKKKINLITDQTLHLVQILVTWGIYAGLSQ